MFRLDTSALEALSPTVVLTQALCDVCALSETDVRHAAAALTPPPAVVSLGGASLAGVWEDVRRVGAAIDRAEEAVELLARLDARLRLVHERLKAAKAPRPRVAVIEWLDPLYSAGHWTPELVRRAGGVDVIATAGAHSVPIALDALRDVAPEVLLFAPCGFDIDRAEREARTLLGSSGWEWARECRAWALDGNALTSRPGPRLADAVEVMSAVFAPALFPPPPDRHARSLSL
jgi:iron complex transport system substrate-binding protein